MADSMNPRSTSRSMNPWVLHLQKMGLELRCPLCLNLLKRPALLPCDHIFCNSCLPERTQFGCECPVCKEKYVDRDLRPMSSIENIVTIYRSLDAAFCANLLGSGPSGSPGLSQLADTRLNQVSGVQKIDLADKCNFPRELRSGDAKQNANSLPVCSQIRAGGIQECETTCIDTNQVDQLSAGSAPSFGDIKSSENDSYDQGDDTPCNYQALGSAKRTPDDTSGTEGANSRDSKRHKKFNYVCTNSISHTPSGLQTENSEIWHSQPEPISSTQPLALLLDSSKAKTICGFCHSSKISQDTGPMLHFINEKLVEGDGASLSNAVHVHKICIDWAPQVYSVEDDTVKNLNLELARGAKLKCSKCGLKGAALGCFQKSCRRSYHILCAMEVLGCRWDYEKFLVLCPSHTSVRFPGEQKSKSKKHHLTDSHVPAQHCCVPPQTAPKQPNFWEESSNGAKEWVFCGSALSSEDKCLLVEFGSMIGVPVTKFWKPSVTHVIAATDTKGACTRTLKVLMAILNGKWVITIDWVKACMKSMRLVDEEAYEVNLDNHGCHSGPQTGRLSILNNAPKLFNNFSFYFSGDFVSGYKEDLQNLVIAAGGSILKSKEELVQESYDLVALSTSLIVYNLDPPQGCKLGEEVTILWERLNEAEDLAAKFGSQVIGHTWLLESIASYKLQPFVNLGNAKNFLP